MSAEEGGGRRAELASPPQGRAEEDPLGLGLCKHWLNTGRCPSGAGCPWAHPDMACKANRALRERWVQARRKRKLGAQRLEGDPHSAAEKARKGERAEVFCRWVLETFPGVKESPRGPEAGPPPPVLDVAGGRGEIAFGLAVRRGVPCTLVDPRPAGWPGRLTKHQRHFLRHLAKAEKKRKMGGGEGGESEEIGAKVGAVGAGGQGGGVDEALAALHQVQEPFDAVFCDRHAGLVRDAPALLGMHPDEATESIVDAALRLRRPFAIVPCCVFPADGRPRSFGAWIDYLRGKSPAIRSAFLPFSGRNQVLYVEHEARYAESEAADPEGGGGGGSRRDGDCARVQEE